MHVNTDFYLPNSLPHFWYDVEQRTVAYVYIYICTPTRIQMVRFFEQKFRNYNQRSSNWLSIHVYKYHHNSLLINWFTLQVCQSWAAHFMNNSSREYHRVWSILKCTTNYSTIALSFHCGIFQASFSCPPLYSDLLQHEIAYQILIFNKCLILTAIMWLLLRTRLLWIRIELAV